MAKRSKPNATPAEQPVEQLPPERQEVAGQITAGRLDEDGTFLADLMERLRAIEVDLAGYVTRWSGQAGTNATEMRQQLTKVMVNAQASQNRLDKAIVSLDGIQPTLFS